LTGLSREQATFQALSCFTGTGFTTKESELITRNCQRRKIAFIIMIMGNVGSVTLIATLANHIRNIFADKDAIFLPFTSKVLLEINPTLLTLINVIAFFLIIYLVYHFFIQSKMFNRLLEKIRENFCKRKIIVPVAFEEFCLGDNNFDVFRINILPESPFCNHVLKDSILAKEQHIKILGIIKLETFLNDPPPETKLEAGDAILCFGSKTELQAAFQELPAK
jgi:hypothetical protein